MPQPPFTPPTAASAAHPATGCTRPSRRADGRRGIAAAAALLLAVLLPTHRPARAQVADTARADAPLFPLDEIEVVSSIVPVAGPRVGVGVTARLTTIGGEGLGAWAPRVLSDALAGVAGMSLYDDLGSPLKTTLVLRGFTASPVVGLPQGVSVFLDGMPVNEPDARQVNFDLLPLQHVHRVELLSGTASMLGPNSLGGAVNLITRRGTAAREVELELGAGSFGARSGRTSAAGSLGGWRYYVGSGYEREDGWREMTGAEQYDAFVSAGRHGASRGIRFVGLGAWAYAETAGSLPLSIYDVQPRANLTAGDFEDLRQLKLALSGYAPLGAGSGALSIYVRSHDAERFNVNQVNDPDVRSFSENRTLGATADWRHVRALAGATLGLRVGASGAVNRTDIRIFGERIDPGLTTHVRSPISEAGVFIVSDYARGGVTLSGGLRLDAVRIPFRNLLDPARDTTSSYVQLNPRVGIAWDATRALSLFASVGRSFRAPAVIELACADPENPCPLPFALGDDPPLDPVTAVTYEAGAHWTRGGFTAGVAAYRTDVRDDIFLFPYFDDAEPVGSTIDGFFANIEATRRAGIELDARLAFAGGRHVVNVGYALSRATFQVDDVELFSIREEHGGGENEVEAGDRLPLVPEHAAQAGAGFRFGMLEVGVATRYTGRRWLRGDEANEETPLDAFTLVHARAALTRGGWGLHATLHNMLDTRYAAFGTFNLHQAAGNVLERFLTPGQPRTLRVSLRRRL